METGTSGAGFTHILDHHPINQFTSYFGVTSESQLSALLYNTITTQNPTQIIGVNQYVYTINGNPLSIIIGSNGFVITRKELVMKYTLRFMFEYGGPCLWANDKNTTDEFGYSVQCEDLPISQMLISKIKDLEKEFQTSLNWENPLDVSSWSLEYKKEFLKRAHIIYDNLTIELGHNFEVIDQINQSVR